MNEMNNSFERTSSAALQAKRARCMGLAGRHGFTMTELLAVIAIIGIMSAIAFVSVTQIQKSMQQKELDETAREIFVAAQNHLTAANAKGYLGRIAATGDAEKIGTKDTRDTDPSKDIRYFVVGDSTSKQKLSRDNSDNVLYQMLPFGSIDDTVRINGTYIIQYDLKSATVLGVFYARSSYSTLFAANTNGFAFVDSDYQALFPAYEGTSATAVTNRQSYRNAMIGWYGGEDVSKYEGLLANPILEIQNSERLVAIVEDTNAGVDSDVLPTLKLVVEGETSGAAKAITLVDAGVSKEDQYSYVEYADGKYYVYLDDITRAGGHFVDIFGGAGFIPGENLTIQAVAYTTAKISNVAESGIAYRNSLFASLVADPNNRGAYTKAKIANIRHLENLSQNVSGFDPNADDWSGKAPTTAVQTSDVSWTDFQTKIAASQEPAPGASTVTVLKYTGSDSTVTAKSGSFMPVTPASGFSLTYEGKSATNGAAHRIENVSVDLQSGNAGIFGEAAGLTISDVLLINPSVATASGNAGALLGAGTGNTVVNNVLAYNEAGADGKYGWKDAEANLEISGSGNAGGLIGNVAAVTIEQSAAALYVKSTTGAAGGLIGATTGNASVKYCYAGGHTVEGKFGDTTTANEAGRVNVIAKTNAGGLVGNASASLAIDRCYSAASTYGEADTGGLVGSMTAGSITNSYTAGLVGAKEEIVKGYFVGAASGSELSFQGNSYLEILNARKDMNDIGMAENQASAADATVGLYREFAGGSSPAFPYDDSLRVWYRGTYPFRTIQELAGTTAVSPQLAMHYGDWPSLEAFVVNVG